MKDTKIEIPINYGSNKFMLQSLILRFFLSANQIELLVDGDVSGGDMQLALEIVGEIVYR
jgi:hypothetical protein